MWIYENVLLLLNHSLLPKLRITVHILSLSLSDSLPYFLSHESICCFERILRQRFVKDWKNRAPWRINICSTSSNSSQPSANWRSMERFRRIFSVSLTSSCITWNQIVQNYTWNNSKRKNQKSSWKPRCFRENLTTEVIKCSDKLWHFGADLGYLFRIQNLAWKQNTRE